MVAAAAAAAAASSSSSAAVSSSGGAVSQAQGQVAGQRPQHHTLTAKVRTTIQSIKEVVGNFSDSDILMALKEANMDPDETAGKLLSQDPFHEVKTKRGRRKESMGYSGPVDTRRHSENVGHGIKPRVYPDRNPRRGGNSRAGLPGSAGTNREFRVVRDNRVNGTANKEVKPALQEGSKLNNEQGIASVTGKSSSPVTSSNVRLSRPRSSSYASNGPTGSQPRHSRDANSSGIERKEVAENKQNTIPNANSRVQGIKPGNSQNQSATLASNNSVVGVYSSSTDPVHVPSPDSRSSAAVGAIKREVGVVGGRRQSSESAVKDSSASPNSFSNSVLGRNNGSLSESFQHFRAISKTDQVAHSSGTEPVAPSRPFVGNQYSRSHQQAVGHQKAPQQIKEWKPKTNQKSNNISPGVIGTPTKSSSPAANNPKDVESDAADLQDKLSQVNIQENQNVIIAEHIRVPENDRCRLTFGSFGMEFDSSRTLAPGYQAVGVTEEPNGESASLSASAPESSNDDASGSKQVDSLDDQLRNSSSDSPPSGGVSEHLLPDKSASPPNLDNYSDIGLVRDSSPSYAPPDSHQQQEPPELSGFSAYDPQAGYEMSYFRPGIDETVRGQGLPSPQEVLTSHAANGIPSSTIPMIQQQQQPVAQVYPPLHVSHYANLMPYRQFVSPVYVPQMPMPGYSGNPAYPHPSNGSSYLVMPGNNSHLNANSIKYGIQPFKPVPGGSPTGFGSYTGPTGYPINAPGVVGGATGLEDSSRIKYKDGNLYVPNPQAETSEIWIPNPRDLPTLQSASYYNMPGQTPHGGYLPSHTGHASFNAAAAAQSSHMQFPGLYPPPPQPAAMANPHHLGPIMSGNVGVGVPPTGPGTQVGAYQQPQLGHLNWTTNF